MANEEMIAAAREFVNSKPIRYPGGGAGEPLATPRWIAEFTESQLKAERIRIEELEAELKLLKVLADNDPEWQADVRAESLAEDLETAKETITRLLKAWDESWDCSGDPGHPTMDSAVLIARACLDRLSGKEEK